MEALDEVGGGSGRIDRRSTVSVVRKDVRGPDHGVAGILRRSSRSGAGSDDAEELFLGMYAASRARFPESRWVYLHVSTRWDTMPPLHKPST